MRITADTNIIVRALMVDDEAQSRIAQRLLAEATLVALPLPVLVEFCWVAERAYKVPKKRIAVAIGALAAADNVVVEMPALAAGLAMLEAGGDFADGVIAHLGQWLGGDCFVSFDRKAVRLLQARGVEATLAE